MRVASILRASRSALAVVRMEGALAVAAMETPRLIWLHPLKDQLARYPASVRFDVGWSAGDVQCDRGPQGTRRREERWRVLGVQDRHTTAATVLTCQWLRGLQG